MTVFDTTTLAAAIMGDDAIETNRKGATRTLRKFLRTDLPAREMTCPGKGGRYALEMNKRELTAMAKRFKAWEAQQEAEKAARAEALTAAKAATAAPAPIEDEADNAPEGPSDEEIAEMIANED
jgi:hypothetical protein